MVSARKAIFIAAFLGLALLPLPGLSAAVETPSTDKAVSFRNDVMAVISRAGCNAGACHGNASGKGGFKISLRGEDPEGDYLVMTRELFGRRVNPQLPDESLLLLKATSKLAHEGGKRFGPDSEEFRLMRQWIADGAVDDGETAPKLVRLDVTPREQFFGEPAWKTQIAATAHYSDGTSRDVTRLAVYESANPLVKPALDGSVQADKPTETTVLVRYLDQQQPVRLAFVAARPDYKWNGAKPANFVDEQIFAKLRRLKLNPSPIVADETFVRRLYLDLTGAPPTSEEAKAFIADKRRDKRTRLANELMERPEFATFWALKWADLLRIDERPLDKKGVQAFHHWLQRAFSDNMPMDRFAREIVAGRGSTYENPAANFYRANRDPVMRSEAIAQLFLGTRLQCAQCHNHPFDRWTQNDYYGWAGVFSQIDYKVIENKRRDDNDSHEFVGKQVVVSGRTGDMKHPKTGKVVPAKMLGDTSGGSDERDRLDRLADWITSPKNPFFAQSQVNRIWFHLMGRGIVDPIDDFRATNPPSHPELLDQLTAEFVKSGYNLRHIVRLIVASKAYQLSSEPNDTNADDETNFSRNLIRRLSAEQILDAQTQVTGTPVEFTGYPVGTRAAEVGGVQAMRARRRLTDGDRYMDLFGRPPRLLTCECERSNETSMGQAFQLISGPLINTQLSSKDNRLTALIKSGRTDEQIVEELYWTTLTRPPNDKERATTSSLLAKAPDKRAALEDVTWALLNSKEFILRH